MSTTKGEVYYPEEFADAELVTRQTYFIKTLIESQVIATDEHCARLLRSTIGERNPNLGSMGSMGYMSRAFPSVKNREFLDGQ